MFDEDSWIETGRLVEAARDGDAGAWQELVDRYAGLVLGVARKCRLSPHDVDDVYQVVWIRLVENLGRIRRPERLAGWLAVTTRREAIRVQNTRRGTSLYAEPADPSAEEVALDELDDAEVLDALHTLDEKCRELLRLAIVEERSYHEIADALDMAMGSIGPSRQRCLDRLRNRMAVSVR
jgi:RNA polymerase sigma factor (sigma-70 family)